ncbi:MAG TPA: DUF2252 domain-containing protein [Propionibacteriaceae bacterium]|nr:DUF2252 domain-containing protein [Propionibacteriaceae bacterium]
MKAHQRTKRSTPVKANQRTKRSTKVPAATGNGQVARQAGQVDHPSLTERAARGKAERKLVPLSVHGEWQPSSDRPDPVALLEEQATTRVPELVPIRYGRMLVSPFTFYRGAAYLMASDLANAPRTSLSVQLCGDAHLSNFGVFAAPDRRLVFSVNDFDETLPGPFEWDVKRLIASFAVAGRDRGFDAKQRKSINLAVARSYRETMLEMAQMKKLDVWYARLDVEEIDARLRSQVKPSEVKRFEQNVAKARSKDSIKAFDKLVQVVDGRPRLVGDPPLIVPIEDLFSDLESHQVDEAIHNLLRSYRRTLAGDHRHLLEGFRYVHAARKVVGVGSVGTRAWIVLMMGHDASDPLFLQAKEAQRSVLEPFLGKSRYRNHGQRVVEGQRLMQSASDIMLGWLRSDGVDGVSRDFYIRQLWDGKGSAVIEAMKPSAMTAYAGLCGWTLARAHARSGDAAAIANYLGTSDKFDRAMAAFAEIYADQNERDYATLKAAVDSKKVAAESA